MKVKSALSANPRKFALGRILSYIFSGFIFVTIWDFYQNHKSNQVYDYIAPPQDSAVSVKSTATSVVSTTTTGQDLDFDFRAIGAKIGTDKVGGYSNILHCANDENRCIHPKAERDVCRSGLHFYDTIYNRWLAPYAAENNPMQFLEIGFYQGKGFETYSAFLSHNKGAELHSMEISCIEPGPQDEGKWPWGNFAKKHRWYQDLLDKDRLHCGDASDYDFLHNKWTTKMKRKDAPPLKVVIDDGAHIHSQMAASLFYWFPRIEPGGILVVEDVEPISQGNKFRTHIVPQVMKDLHWCGGPSGQKTLIGNDPLCFPTIQPLLQGIHCEMHICVFVRNNVPAHEPDKAGSITPSDAFENAQKCLFG